jgi:tetratricopeptide (TPR) repeat protein
MSGRDFEELQAAFARGDHHVVLEMTGRILEQRPGDDAAHELRARALLALGRAAEAEREAGEAVRLDPDEIRYRELLAETLAAEGAHREAAGEFARLARNDPRQREWTLAEAGERLDGAQAELAADAARRAVRLDPSDGMAQLTLARALLRLGDPAALQAAAAAAELRPGDPAAREALADARWLADQPAAAFSELASLAAELSGPARDRVMQKARALYRQRAGWWGRAVAGVSPVFGLALRAGWLHVS